MSWRNGRSRKWRLLASSVTAIGLTLLLLNPTVANAATAQVDKPRASLTASWWEKFFELSDRNSFQRCDVGTPKIVFLAGTTTSGSATRSCTTDKNIFLVPLINFECSTAEDDFTTFAELRECAKPVADDFTDLTLVIDGKVVNNLSNLRVEAKSHFNVVEDNVFNVEPYHNSKFVADGYWALITLSPGTHTITFGGSYVPEPNEPPAFTTEVTYNLIVQA